MENYVEKVENTYLLTEVSDEGEENVITITEEMVREIYETVKEYDSFLYAEEKLKELEEEVDEDTLYDTASEMARDIDEYIENNKETIFKNALLKVLYVPVEEE